MKLGTKILLAVSGLVGIPVLAGYAWFRLNKKKIFDNMIANASNVEDIVGREMPAFDVEQPSGARVTKDMVLEGKEVAAVVLYASWCGPCEREFPEMDSVYQKYRDKMGMVGIDVDILDDMDDVQKYEREHNLSFPLAIGNESLDFVKTKTYPTTLLVDRNGIIQFFRIGSIPEADTFEKLVTSFMGDDYVPHQPGYYTFVAYSDSNPVPGVEFSVSSRSGTQAYTTGEDGTCSVIVDSREDLLIKVTGVPDVVQLVDGGEKKGGLVSTIIKLPVE